MQLFSIAFGPVPANLICVTGTLLSAPGTPGGLVLQAADRAVAVESAAVDLSPLAGQPVVLCGTPTAAGGLQVNLAITGQVAAAPLGTAGQALTTVVQAGFGGITPLGFARGTTVSAAVLASL